jgi:hypothetical protein
MNYFDGFADFTPLVLPLEPEWPTVWRLVERLKELNYNEKVASEALGVRYLAGRNTVMDPYHLKICRGKMASSPAAILTAFFLMQEWTDRSVLVDLLGESAVKLMHNLRWTRKREQQLGFRNFLFPCQGRYVLTDGIVEEAVALNNVYRLGSDSYILTWLTPRKNVGYTLDHCTGSGVHALLASFHAERSYGLDINLRALSFSRFNAGMNQANNLSYIESDCYQNVIPEKLGTEDLPKFDLITANPPFVPTPDSIALCRGGGVSGEEVTEKIVRGLPENLAADGLFAMITNIPVFKNQSFFERAERWLEADGQNFAMISLHCHVWNPAEYAVTHLGCGAACQRAEELERWLDSYAEIGLEWVTYSQVYFFRQTLAAPWRIERNFRAPAEPRGDFVSSWLDSLRRFQDQPQEPQVFARHPELETVWWMEGRERVHLAWNLNQQWWHSGSIWLDGEASRIFALFEQPRPFQWSTSQELACLRWLLQENILQVQV